MLNEMGVKDLSWALDELRSLQFLLLRELPIKHIPDGIGNCTSLLYLHVSLFNLATPLPHSIANLTALRELTVPEGLRFSPAIEDLVAVGQGKFELVFWTFVDNWTAFIPQMR